MPERVPIIFEDVNAIGPFELRSGGDVITVGGSPPPPPVELVEIMRGPAGPQGPSGVEPDIPDLTLIFDNRLV